MNTDKARHLDVFVPPAAAPVAKLSFGKDSRNKPAAICSVDLNAKFSAGDTVAGISEEGNICKVILGESLGVDRLNRNFVCRLLAE